MVNIDDAEIDHLIFHKISIDKTRSAVSKEEHRLTIDGEKEIFNLRSHQAGRSI